MDDKGLLLCARYSAAPNYFGYCGPDENSSLIDHLKEGVADKEVEVLLSEFETLFLNLSLIAYENGIKNPFDRRVVEAYWIGNSLLHSVKNGNYTALLKEKFNLEKKIGQENFAKINRKFLNHVLLPHHSFHVFNIFKRTGNIRSKHTLETMDSCRIGFGEIVKIGQDQISNFEDQKNKSKVKDEYIIVKSKPLTKKRNKLMLDLRDFKSLRVNYGKNKFIKNLKIGDWISFHWGYVCDLLTDRQVKNLEFYTQKAIDFYNSS